MSNPYEKGTREMKKKGFTTNDITAGFEFPNL